MLCWSVFNLDHNIKNSRQHSWFDQLYCELVLCLLETGLFGMEWLLGLLLLNLEKPFNCQKYSMLQSYSNAVRQPFTLEQLTLTH